MTLQELVIGKRYYMTWSGKRTVVFHGYGEEEGQVLVIDRNNLYMAGINQVIKAK